MVKRALSLLWGLLLLGVLPVAGQPSGVCQSVTFLDAQGQPAASFEAGDRISFRVVAPAANFQSGERDEVYMLLSSRDGGDQESLSAYETGPNTGVFERSIRLAAGGPNPQDGRLQTASPSQPTTGPVDQISVRCGDGPPDAEADVLGPTVRFVDDGGHGTTAAVTGFQLHLRVVDHTADVYPSADTATVHLIAAGGDDETVTLMETGASTGVFEGTIPLVAGSAAPSDATLQANPGTTLEAQLQAPWGPTLAVAQAPVVEQQLSFLDASGAPLSELIEGDAVRVQLLDTTQPWLSTVLAYASATLTGDQESVTLTADPDRPGRYKGTLQLGIPSAYPFDGRLTTGRTYTTPEQFDTVAVSYCASACATATATTRNPEIRLLDAAGRDASVFAAGAPVRVRVYYPLLPPGYPETFARLESLATGDLLDSLLLGAIGGSRFEATVPTASGSAAADGTLQVQPGETVRATHLDFLNRPSAAVTARIQAATLDFVDASGAPASVYLVGRPVFLRAVDPAANANPAQAETVTAYVDVEMDTGFPRDREAVTLAETGPNTGVFAGSIPLLRGSGGYAGFGNGVLHAGAQPESGYRADTLRALLADASATAATVPSVLRLIDAQGNDAAMVPLGGAVRIEVDDPSSDQPGQQDQIFAMLESVPTGDFEYVLLTETGTDTGVFTGSMPTAAGPASPNSYTLEVEAGGSIVARYSSFGPESQDRAEVAADRPPVVQDESVSTPEDTPVTVDVLANDSDPDGQPLTVTAAVPYLGSGTVTVNPDSTITFTPDPDSFGYTETITYTVSDGTSTATGTLAVEVVSVNDPPIAGADARTTDEDTPVVLTVLINDSDPEGGLLDVVGFGAPAHGTIEPHPLFRGDYSYVPAPDFNGTDSFTYTVRDSDGGTATGTVTVTVVPVDDAPFVLDDAATTSEDTAVSIPVLANDSDVDDTLTLTSVTQPAHGTAALGTGGSITYTPAPNFTGTDTFDYHVQAGSLDAVATVTITVTPVNDAPDAVNDSATTNEDTAVTVSVLGNDTDPDSDSLTVTAVTQGTKGSVTINGGATVTYTPNANANGSDSFTYTISDGHGGSDTATVAVTITAVNDAPDAVNDSATTNEDTAVTVSVLGNDSDPENEPLTVTAVTQGTKGSVTINGGATVTYTPNANVNGSDSFTYTISDGHGGSDTATVAVTITAVNDAPDAVNDSATTNEDTAVTVSVLGNDTDPENDSLTVTAVTQGTKGSVTINGGTTVTYTPNANINGSDSFTYTISDGHGGSDTATVAVTITAVNDGPDAINDSATTNEDTAVTVAVLGNDTDPENDSLTVAAVTQGTKGSVTINGGATVTYTPNANANGSDSFTYTISDGHGGTDTATVAVTITAVNDAPDAVNDSATTNEDMAVTASVRGNDTDPDNDSLTITAVTQGTKGSVTINGGATVTYTPNANANGSDSFTYTISDGHGGSDTATVAVTITAVNDAPDAVNDSATTNEDTAVTVSVLGNDTDPDSDSLTVTAVTQGTKGSVTINGGATVTYTPNANANGSDSFTYTISDGHGGTDTATVAVNITPVNDSPDAINDAAATNEDTAITIAILANDVDADGEALTVTAVTQGTKGSVVLNANGTVTYVPAANMSGADAFTYTVRDAAGATDTATVSVAIAAVNDPPSAAADAATTREGVAVAIFVLSNDSDVEGNPLTVTSASTPAHGTVIVNANSTLTYNPATNFDGTDSFTYTVSDGQGGTATAVVTITVKDSLERTALLATHGAWIQTGADVLSGDVIVNQSGAAPFLDSANAVELSVAGTVTTPAGWDVKAPRLNVAAGSTVSSDAAYNTLTGGGAVNGTQTSPLALPVFSTLPSFRTSTPGTTDVNVGTNVSRTLAPGSYRDLIVGKRGIVTFTGGLYHFRSISVNTDAKLLFSAASELRVQQKVSTLGNTQIAPSASATIDGSDVILFVAGVNGTGGTLAETPKAVEIGTDNVLWANIYAPNGTIWIKDRTQARGAHLGKDIQIGPDVQVTLDSYWIGQ